MSDMAQSCDSTCSGGPGSAIHARLQDAAFSQCCHNIHIPHWYTLIIIAYLSRKRWWNDEMMKWWWTTGKGLSSWPGLEWWCWKWPGDALRICAGATNISNMLPSATFLTRYSKWNMLGVPSGYLTIFNIAMGNGPFIDGLPIQNGDFPWLC